jgi:hypothetical protein
MKDSKVEAQKPQTWNNQTSNQTIHKNHQQWGEKMEIEEPSIFQKTGDWIKSKLEHS